MKLKQASSIAENDSSKKIIILCGIPGSGKSTWAANTLNAEVVSRDIIRFSLLKDDEDYFSHEDEVFSGFINWAQQAIDDPKVSNVIIDATHLTPASRRKILRQLRIKPGIKIIAAWFDVDLLVCLDRNNQRTGRNLVPKDVIRRMWNQKILPTLAEGFNEIWTINEEGLINHIEVRQ